MIVAVKRKRNWKSLQIFLLILVVGACGAYYYKIDKENKEKIRQENIKKQNLKLQEEQKEQAKKEAEKEAEKIIISEVEKAISLIGQENVKQIKLIDNKIAIVCEPNTNLEALNVRYGVMAFIKKTLNEVVVAIDVDFILKNKINEK